MKKNVLLISILLIVTGSVSAQGKAPYKVVIDVTSSDTLVHQMAMRWVAEITNSDPKAQVELVFYAGGVDMVVQGKSVVGDNLKKYSANANVAFSVCEVAMKNRHVSKDQLIAGVATVPDGIYEIVQRQYEGWGYIKASR